MASQDDFSECDIWEYKPALKKQAKSVPERGSLCVAYPKTKKRKAVQHPKAMVKSKEKAPSKMLYKIGEQEDGRNKGEHVQIIDVDLEMDNDISISRELSLSESYQQVKSCSNTKISPSSTQASSAFRVSKDSFPSQTFASSSKTMAQKRSSQKLSSSKSKSPVSKSRRTSGSSKSNSNEEKCMLSIDTYFSPKKVNSITSEDIKYPMEDIIDLSDDDFEEADKNTCIIKDDIKIPNDGVSPDGEKQSKQISHNEHNSQSCQQLPLVNVDVIVEEEGEQSSFELGNRLGTPSGNEVDIGESFCQSASNKCVDKNTNGLTDERYELSLTHDVSSNEKDENTTSDVPSCLLRRQSSSEIDDLFSEDEEGAQNKVSNNNKETLENCVSKPYLLSLNKDACDQNSQNDPTDESGGFFPEVDTTEIDSSPREKNAKSIAPIEPMPEKVPLVSNATWPTMVSSATATKQTTLFSFLKAKPRFKTPLNQEPPIPKLTKSVSESHNKVACRSDGANSSSSSSTWKSQNSGDTFDINTQRNGKGKQCPFYKRMPGTPITVDAFRYGVIPGCEAYVLTHFHYDHYGGLTKKFSQPIYCSQVTGNLVESRIGVHNKWINRLPMWKPCKVANATLTLMEANHCPGAVIILFELNDGRKILHTGDFRASPDMETYSALEGIKISELYLDTTYCNPSYAFPDQTKVVHFVVDLVLKHMSDHPSTLIVCGAYTIGKERIFQAIAKALDSKVCVMNDKKKVLDCLEDQDLKSRVTLDWSAGRVHVLPMGKLNQQHLKEHLARHHHFKSILAFQPTGWTHSDKQTSLAQLKPKWSKDGITLYGVPYSEHSSFLELKRFVQHFRPLKILPTVNNGSPEARSKMDTIFKQWMHEKKIEKIN